MMNINEVRKLIYKHGEKIGLPYDSKLYPIFSSTGNVFSDGGTIYISNNEYRSRFVEKNEGTQTGRCDTDDSRLRAARAVHGRRAGIDGQRNRQLFPRYMVRGGGRTIDVSMDASDQVNTVSKESLDAVLDAISGYEM